MNFDYSKMDGEFWNTLPFDDQLDILNKYYPIGQEFLYSFSGSEANILIKEYILSPSYIYTKGFYKIKALVLSSHSYYTNVEEMTIHPGHLKPILRNVNLKELGI